MTDNMNPPWGIFMLFKYLLMAIKNKLLENNVIQYIVGYIEFNEMENINCSNVIDLIIKLH